jgi:hypothetical protein
MIMRWKAIARAVVIVIADKIYCMCLAFYESDKKLQPSAK